MIKVKKIIVLPVWRFGWTVFMEGKTGDGPVG
jgi:hypothetical protein